MCCNFEQGNGEAACSVFDAALQSEKLKEDSRALAVLYIQYARFLDQVSKLRICRIFICFWICGSSGEAGQVSFSIMQLSCVLTCWLSLIPLQVLNREDKAREVYMTALDHLPTSKVLWEVLVDFVESELVCLFALIR
jgi:hypothetical protein